MLISQIYKIPRRNHWRIVKHSKFDFEETYERVDQRPDLSDAALKQFSIDNIYILKSFRVIIWFIEQSNPINVKKELLTIQHCKEADLGEQLGKEIHEIQYSENGRIFLDPSQKGPFVYGNLRAGNFNVVHVLI